MSLRVLYLGDRSGTSLHRADAFERLGFELTHISPREALPRSAWIDRIEWHLTPRFLSPWIKQSVDKATIGRRFDVVWVDSGSLVSPELLSLLKQRSRKIVNFNHDDPYGERDWTRFKEYRRAVPAYDLMVVVREPNVPEALSLGAQAVMLVTRTADEVAHAPKNISEEILGDWSSDVAFVGTWMPERGAFMKRLVELGVPLSIFGSGWSKAPEWNVLKPYHRMDHLEGDAYAWAIQCAKVSLGLLSKGNRDLHTTRSLEIPMLGGLLCAERTSEHLAMYREDKEAVFWSDADECAKKCLSLLSDPNRIAEISQAGQRRVKVDGNTSESMILKVICRVGLK